MCKAIYKIAGHIISFKNASAYLEKSCQGYEADAADGPPEAELEISVEDIEYERAKQNAERGCAEAEDKEQEWNYPDHYLEFLAALRKLGEWLPTENVVLCHGAAISLSDGNGEAGYIFMAPSGIGKTTHIQLWKKYLGSDVKVVNGDKPFIAYENGKIWIYGSPWAGKEKMHLNTKVPLRGICFIRRASENHTERIASDKALKPLLKQIYIPQGSAAVEKTLEMAEAILENVPVYCLYCNISEEAVKNSYEALTGQRYGRQIIDGGNCNEAGESGKREGGREEPGQSIR